jgi:hypothetical protein
VAQGLASQLTAVLEERKRLPIVIHCTPLPFTPAVGLGTPGYQDVSFFIPAAPVGGWIGTITRVYQDNNAAWDDHFSTLPNDPYNLSSTHQNSFPPGTGSGTVKTQTYALWPQQIADIIAAAGIGLTGTINHTTTTGPANVYSDLYLTLTEANDGWGDTGTGGGQGSYPDPITLAGTGINPITSPMRALAARTHRSANNQRNDVELWYLDTSNATWYRFPRQPVMDSGLEPVMTRTYRQPTTLECRILDQNGVLTPENLNSPWNYNRAGAYDPLMDEARKILLRASVYSYDNLAAQIVPTSSLAPTSGVLAELTDGALGNILSSTANYVKFMPATGTAFEIVVDMGSLQQIHHLVIRFATQSGTCVLPSAVTVGTSEDNVTWLDQPARPVGGPGSVGVAPGDWADDYDGRTIDVSVTDIEQPGRYVRFTILPTSSVGISLMIDELAVYAGGAGGPLGKNYFCGYLGDMLEFTPEGICRFRATSVEKKLADNNESRLTTRFMNEDIGDIAWTILTQAPYWPGTGTEYDAPFTLAEVGWNYGVTLTGLLMPIWQGQGNSLYGYILDLFNEVGWMFYGDGNGVCQVLEPAFSQYLPDRVFIAALDGNNDVRDCVRQRTGKDMRNTVDISVSDPGSSGASSIISDPTSAARYGHRRVTITDPVATTNQLRQAIANYILRDYRFRLQTLGNSINPDFDTQLRMIGAFRAPARPNLYGSATSLAGDMRLQELWALTSLEEHITPSTWYGNAQWIPYSPSGTDAPSDMTLSSPSASTYVVVGWDAVTDPHAETVNGYISTTSDITGFTPAFSVPANVTILGSPTLSEATITGLVNGEEVWIYLTTVDVLAQESLAGSIVGILVGGGAASTSGWAITDLSAGFDSVTGPDGSGNFTYEVALTWTSPPNGCKRWEVYYSLGAEPANPNDMTKWKYTSSWRGQWQPPGTTLFWYARIQVNAELVTGTKIYIRMLTSDRNTSDGGVWPESNIVFVTIP